MIGVTWLFTFMTSWLGNDVHNIFRRDLYPNHLTIFLASKSHMFDMKRDLGKQTLMIQMWWNLHLLNQIVPRPVTWWFQILFNHWPYMLWCTNYESSRTNSNCKNHSSNSWLQLGCYPRNEVARNSRTSSWSLGLIWIKNLKLWIIL
jgi:hypothetical protein